MINELLFSNLPHKDVFGEYLFHRCKYKVRDWVTRGLEMLSHSWFCPLITWLYYSVSVPDKSFFCIHAYWIPSFLQVIMYKTFLLLQFSLSLICRSSPVVCILIKFCTSSLLKPVMGQRRQPDALQRRNPSSCGLKIFAEVEALQYTNVLLQFSPFETRHRWFCENCFKCTILTYRRFPVLAEDWL